MSRKRNILLSIFCISCLVVASMVPFYLAFTPRNTINYSSNLELKGISEPKKAVTTSIFPAVPAPTTNLDNVNITGTVILENDSVVYMKDSNIKGVYGNPVYYLFANSKLTLDNVSILSDAIFVLNDNATMILKNTDDNGYTVQILSYDSSRVYINGSNLASGQIICFDNSSVSGFNSAFGYAIMYNNASLYSENSTFSSDIFASYTTRVTLKNVAMKLSQVSFSRNATGVLDSCYLYYVTASDNATMTIVNSQITTVYITEMYSKAIVENSTISTFSCGSNKISEIYNSTISNLYQHYIIYGDAVYTKDTLTMLSGSFEFNVKVDASSTINTITNVTIFHVLSGGKLLITQQITNVQKAYCIDSSLIINASNVPAVVGYRSTITIANNSDVAHVRGYDRTQITSMDSGINIVDLFSSSKLEISNSPKVLRGTLTSSVLIGDNIALYVTLHSNSVVNLTNFWSAGTFFADSNSILNLSNGYANDTQYTLINSTLIGQGLNFSNANVTLDPSTFTISDSLVDNLRIDSTYSVLSFNNCTGTLTTINLFSSELTSTNSTLGSIFAYNDSIVTIRDHSKITYIDTDTNDTSTITVTDSYVHTLDVRWLSVSATATRSSFYRVYYSVNVTSGEINITDNKISGTPSNYVTTFMYDSQSNVSSFYLVLLQVNSAKMFISNLTKLDVIQATNSEIHIYNVTGAGMIYFSGTTLEINQGKFMMIYVDRTSKNSLHINGTLCSGLYAGFEYNITAMAPRPSGEVYGNITFSTIDTIMINNGVIGLENVTVVTLVSGALAKTYLYNVTLLSPLRQTYIFTSGGNIYQNVVTGYSDLGIIDVAGNTYPSTEVGVAVNLGGILVINSSSCTLFAYNNSLTYISNTSDINGFVLYDYAVVFVDNSNIWFTYIAPNVMMDGSELYLNNTQATGLAMYGNSYLNTHNATFIGYTNPLRMATLELYEYSRANIEQSQIGEQTIGVVLLADNSQLSARNANITADGIEFGITASGSSIISWNESSFEITDASMYPSIIQLQDNSSGVFDKVTINSTSAIYVNVYIKLLDNGKLVAINFQFPNSTRIYAKTLLYNSSTAQFFDAVLYIVVAYDESSFDIHNSEIIRVEVYHNATGAVLNDNYNPYEMESFLVSGYSAELTITNASVSIATIRQTAVANLYDVNNTNLVISVENAGILNANNLTAERVMFIYGDPAYTNVRSYINNSYIHELWNALTFYNGGTGNFTTYTRFSSLSNSIFSHVRLNYVITSVFRLCIKILDTIKVNGTNADIAYLYVGYENDTAPPIVTPSPSTLEFESGATGKYLSFTVSDSHPYMYLLERNGSSQDFGFYTDGETLTFDVSNYPIGTWIVTLTANDTAGNTASASVTVIIYPNEPPVFTNTPPSIYNMTKGSTGNVLSWIATDKSPAYYELYINGTLKVNSSWTSGVPIEYNIDSFDKGTYNVTLRVYDEIGNSATHSVIVIVSEAPSGPGSQPSGGTPTSGLPFEFWVLAGIVGLVLLLSLVTMLKRRRRKQKTTKGAKSKKNTKRKTTQKRKK